MLYLFLFIFFWKGTNYNYMTANAIAQSLNRLARGGDYFQEFVYKKSYLDAKKLNGCLYYHHKIVDLIPKHAAEGYAMLGFCHERLGQYKQAMDAYERSIQLNPSFFWTYYDAGLIYFHQHQYDKAQKYFQKAVDQSPLVAVLLPITSKVFKDVVASRPGIDYDLNKSLYEGYRRAFILLILAAEKTEQYSLMMSTALRAIQQDKIEDRIFFYYAGVSAYKIKLYNAAIEWLSKYIKISQDHWQAFYYLALSFQAVGKQNLADHFRQLSEHLKKINGSTIEEEANGWRVQFF